VFGVPVIIQPAYLDERPAHREGWKGISSIAFLNQVLRRHQKNVVACLGITEYNIVPSKSYNFLFGQAYLGVPAAVVSLHPLEPDQHTVEKIAERAAKIAIHELGHTFGLDHHEYEENSDCVMTGDEELDCVEGIDEGTAEFCTKCAAIVRKRLRSGESLDPVHGISPKERENDNEETEKDEDEEESNQVILNDSNSEADNAVSIPRVEKDYLCF